MFSNFTNNSVRKKFKLSLSIALVFMLLLCGVGLFSGINSSNRSATVSTHDPIIKPEEKPNEQEPDVNIPNDEFEDNNDNDVVVAEEKLVLPFSVDATISRHYFDIDDSLDVQSKSVYYFNGVYKPNTGVDYSFNDEIFEVKAAFKGTVSSIKNDTLLGYCVYVNNGNGLTAVYASLSEVKVKEGQELAQGDIIGLAGTNAIGSDLGNHLHFAILKNDVLVNPTSFMNKKLSEIN